MAVAGVVGTGTDNTGMHPHLRLADNHLDPASLRPKVREQALSQVTVARVTYSYVLVNALVSAITARNRNQPPLDPL
jgi:hypothetical protein